MHNIWAGRARPRDCREVCTWFDGNFHVVCNAERERADGSAGRSLSILSYVSNEGYVHVGIGNKGSYETLQDGTFRGSLFEFLSTTREGGKSIATRIQIGPFGEHGFPFVVSTSTDGGPWVAAGTTDYVKLEYWSPISSPIMGGDRTVPRPSQLRKVAAVRRTRSVESAADAASLAGELATTPS